jgi:GT2 family glycosyltransferase
MSRFVDVVIANFNGERFLPECLDSVRAQTLAPGEVVVVDAGSTDGSAEVARAHGAVVVEAENRGLGHLYNCGVARSRAAYVFVANNDVELDPHCLERLAAALEGWSDGFAADPRQDAWTTGDLVHARTVIRRGPLLRQPIPGFRLDLRAPAEEVVPTACTNAGGMLVHRARHLELGGFDETFFLDFEDLDLCWRAWARGWASIHVPDAVMRHHVGMSHGGRRRPLARRHAQSHHNLLRWALKCLPPGEAGRVVLGEALRLPRHPLVVGRGVAQLARRLPSVLRDRRIVPSKRLVLERILSL